MSAKEILILRSDADSKMGTGHLMRCLALGQAWSDAGGKVVFITACRNQALLHRLRQEKFEIHRLAQSYPEPADWKSTEHILAGYPKAWVVLDGYHFDATYQQQFKKAGYRLLVIDDMAHLKHYYADILLNQNLHSEHLSYSCEPYTCLLLGTRYVLLRREFLAWKDWRREIPEVGKHVLVTLGGSDPANYTLKVIQALQKVEISGLEATVVVGASNRHLKALGKAAAQSIVSLRIIRDARNMPELMSQADIAISAAGITSWELVYMGLPMVLLPLVPEHEKGIQLLEKERAALRLKQDTGAESWSAVIQDLLKDKKKRSSMRKAGMSLVDGSGLAKTLSVLKYGNAY